MKKLFTLILSVLLVFSAIAAPWNGTIATSFAGGSGTASDPYLIGTAEQLAYLSQQSQTNTLSGVYFKLTADIDLNGPNFSWTPIGATSTTTTAPTVPFRGHFEGNNHVISNIYIVSTTAYYVGLFSAIKRGSIRNLIIGAGQIEAKTFVGAFAGRADSVSVYNCQNNASVKSTTTSSNVGGFFGRLGGISTIEYSSNLGNVSGTSDYVGGIIGNSGVSSVATDYSYIRYCYNTGSVSTSTKYAGGICGTNSGNLTISQCYNEGSIGALQDYSGGIVGYGYGLLTILNCYNVGSVKQTGTSSSTAFTGGILGGVGSNAAGKYFKEIKNCYNTGALINGVREAIAGALTGGALAGGTGVITNSYFIEHPTQENSVNGGVLKTAADLITPEFLGLLNASQTPSPWTSNVNYNGGNPILTWQLLPIPPYTEINNVETQNNYKVYTLNKTIHVDINDNSPVSISIYDVKGSLLKQQKAVANSFETTVSKSGVYIVNIISGNNSYASKMIVL